MQRKTVDSNKEEVIAACDLNVEHAGIIDHQRTSRERMSSDRHYLKTMRLWLQYWATRTHGIGSRTRRRCHYQAIGIILIEQYAIDRHRHRHHRRHVALQDGHLIQGKALVSLLTFWNVELQEVAVFHLILCIAHYARNGSLYLVKLHIGKETQSPSIDAKDRDTRLTNLGGSAQESAITTYAESHVGTFDRDISVDKFHIVQLLQYLFYLVTCRRLCCTKQGNLHCF